ncbi:hypothetical protein [Thioclava atlantica]|uniref:Uncharacterized protein n=1 Tax=Thioclava atlantica TaxID=1317124 RepID=A0A085TSQ6_9RHOB|nr:hypothetical protein [Thioclava atlantica]KFE33753.1 hypothetical protein DW2_16035 [Thioclava atlantica]
MNPVLEKIPDRILKLALGALAQANTHAVYFDPGNEHWEYMSVLNAAHAGELVLKAIIAREHPLLIFNDIFKLDDERSDGLDLEKLIRKGKTHSFEQLPKVLWAVTGIRTPNLECFDRLRKARNSIQHFCAPDDDDLRALSLEFLYTIIDPLLADCFGVYTIEYHEDPSVGYDYVVGALIAGEIRFTMPNDFDLSEIEVPKLLREASEDYRVWFSREVEKIGKIDLLS